jgi:histidinol-phosphate aminotransferase
MGEINKRIREIQAYVAGATKAETARRHDLDPEKIIKLASNENPFGPSPRVIETIRKHAPFVFQYPEDYPGDLIKAISNYVRLPEETIIPGGNGADEVMDIFIKMFVSEGDEVIIHTPTFPYYELLAKLYGAKVVKSSMLENFAFPCNDIIDNIDKKTKLVIICSPNNPTGGAISEGDLRKILDTGAMVIQTSYRNMRICLC